MIYTYDGMWFSYKRNEVPVNIRTSMNLENFAPWDETKQIIWFRFYEISSVGKFIKTESRLESYQRQEGGRNGELLLNDYWVFVWDDKNTSEVHLKIFKHIFYHPQFTTIFKKCVKINDFKELAVYLKRQRHIR